jgi:uncharacterized protein YjiS (DUF1127 family)
MEVAMNDTLTSGLHRTARPGTSVALAEVPRRLLATLRSIIVTWEERKRFRWDLEQRSNADPHLIDDIGLTRQQVEAEIAKPFWRA